MVIPRSEPTAAQVDAATDRTGDLLGRGHELFALETCAELDEGTIGVSHAWSDCTECADAKA
ncbi:MAG: hypothetical protein H0T46_19985 [Deltaproteobacteria bacterium]|nr:hypothetical protein [Deltaproteobacteria bacterium]